jgi:hypothetical protein
MNIDDLKRQLQAIFVDGIVTIVGSGLSCAEGLPGMGALADRLKAVVPGIIDAADAAAWDVVVSLLDSGTGLETALQEAAASSDLDAAIVSVTADYLVEEEGRVLAECINTERVLRFARLLPHLSASTPKHSVVVTTNYDRLIEFAVESAGWGVDVGFVGRLWGRHDPMESDKSFVKGLVQHGKYPKLAYRDRIRLYKPHGSLDWFLHGDQPVCSTIPVRAQRLMITPGDGKYRLGYNQPFDSHREGANAAVDGARAYLCIGYGFNDDHLQTHLTPRLKAGVPTVLLSRGLTPAAEAVISASANALALIHSDDPLGTTVVTQTGREIILNAKWWDLEHFIKEVLEA